MVALFIPLGSQFLLVLTIIDALYTSLLSLESVINIFLGGVVLYMPTLILMLYFFEQHNIRVNPCT